MRCLILVLSLVLIPAVQGFSKDVVVEDFDREFDVSGIAELDVHNQDGKTTFTAGGTSKVKVHVVKEVRNASSEEQAKKEADRVQVRVEQTGNRILIDANYKHSIRLIPGPVVYVHYDITAPANSQIQAQSSDGDVTAAGFDSEVDLSTSDGNIVMNRCSGTLRVSTSDGDLSARDCSGAMRFTSSDGDMILDNVNGEVTTKTSDGDVTIKGLEGSLESSASEGKIVADGIFTRLRARVSDGSIDIAAQKGSKMTNDWSLSSTDGNITLRVPKDFAGDVDIRTSDGSIETDPPISMTGPITDHRVRGKMNGGGVTLLQVNTSDGDVRIANISE